MLVSPVINMLARIKLFMVREVTLCWGMNPLAYIAYLTNLSISILYIFKSAV